MHRCRLLGSKSRNNAPTTRPHFTKIGTLFTVLVFMLSLVGGPGQHRRRAGLDHHLHGAGTPRPADRYLHLGQHRPRLGHLAITNTARFPGCTRGRRPRPLLPGSPKSSYQRPGGKHKVLLPDAIQHGRRFYLTARILFLTQRAAGSTFNFDVTTDSHVGMQGLGNATTFSQA